MNEKYGDGSVGVMVREGRLPVTGSTRISWRGPTEGACSMAVPVMSTRPRTSALRMPPTHPAIRKANHG